MRLKQTSLILNGHVFKELPRHSDNFYNNFGYSNLSPDASIFTPSLVTQSNVFVPWSPVVDFDQSSESTETSIDTLLSDSQVSDSHQNIVCEQKSSVTLSSPELREISPVRVDMPKISVAVSDQTEKQPEPVEPPKVSKNSNGLKERKLVQCHLCKREFDALSEGCCYFDHLRLNDLLYFCRELCMNCYKDSDMAVTQCFMAYFDLSESLFQKCLY